MNRERPSRSRPVSRRPPKLKRPKDRCTIGGTTKIRWRTRAAAEAYMHSVWASGFRGAKMPIRAYPCDSTEGCKGWHLTSQEKRPAKPSSPTASRSCQGRTGVVTSTRLAG